MIFAILGGDDRSLYLLRTLRAAGHALRPCALELALPDYDEYDGVAFIYRKGCGRKTVFVPGLTDFLATQPHD